MFAQLVPNSYSHNAVIYDVCQMPRDFKRILRVQFKEFLHWLDDSAPAGTFNAGSELKDIA